ncbi:MAG: alpha-ketoglutarate-dependent dioxygenase AlkB [Cardiobacteriaceae bacterium]|nr:alpha-ketoglutarate-dependent dioxygenase AlkB [Cardiobacteriaceae bacterium]
MQNNLELFAVAENLLPGDGIVNDYGILFPATQADEYLRILRDEIAWQADEIILYGKRITSARHTAWYGEPGLRYRYSGIARHALPWHPLLLELKSAVETRIAAASPARFNSCLLNRYRDGSEGMGWHSDDERELGEESVIASLSFGATRKFAFRHKENGEKRECFLAHGQLLVMHGTTQRHWQHAIMKSRKVQELRISLTFRTIFPG